MKKNIRVSVIVPIYNVEYYIERCVRSLLEQTMMDIEFIFIDDCSTDKSIVILNSIITDYPFRLPYIKIIRHSSNRGVSVARNTGLSEANGEYIIFCDSDDWIEKEMYEDMYNIASTRQYDIVLCDVIMHTVNKTQGLRTVDSSQDKLKMLSDYISHGWNFVYNILAHRSLYIENNLRFMENCNFCEDYGLSVLLIYYAKTIYTRRKFYYHYNRENINSITNTSINRSKLLKTTYDEIKVYSYINEFFKTKDLYKPLEMVLSWRILKAKRGLLFKYSKRSEYLTIYPESNFYIESNPFCSNRDKCCQKYILKPYWFVILSIVLVIIELRNFLKLN